MHVFGEDHSRFVRICSSHVQYQKYIKTNRNIVCKHFTHSTAFKTCTKSKHCGKWCKWVCKLGKILQTDDRNYVSPYCKNRSIKIPIWNTTCFFKLVCHPNKPTNHWPLRIMCFETLLSENNALAKRKISSSVSAISHLINFWFWCSLRESALKRLKVLVNVTRCEKQKLSLLYFPAE